ncbi:hypothetical protein MLD38_020141 [Melastoma candidum]|uniref:Uncharacterized protein n=1 Tax=Melastoma candidum TaxID=119954 RepID=A0ACB9QCY1_9MYRT|nr:hypothetical protein MLD38_020141 [Melastoma candidum]
MAACLGLLELDYRGPRVKDARTRAYMASPYEAFSSPNNDRIDIVDLNNTSAPLHDLTASDCWIQTKSSAIKIHSLSWFDF